jgi:hypothetical protein
MRPVLTRPLLPALALLLAGTVVATPAAGSDPTGTAAAAADDTAGPVLAPLAPVRLDHAVRGRAAIRALGDRLDDAARLNGERPAELRALLEDPTTWLDPDGRLYVVDETPEQAPTPTPEAAAGAAPYPLDETFALHSRPGSTRTVFLDLDGHTVTGTAWNSSKGVTTEPLPAWSLDGSSAFSDTERAAIQSIWQRVAEDYAPFDVDVTTEDPGEAAIARSSLADTVFGTRALITPSSQAATAICGSGGCGGVAYVGAFDVTGSTHDRLQPAFVFPHLLGNDIKNIAEAVSHEVGHNLGLHHDGRTDNGRGSAEEYYSGHGFWAPIMGAGYSAALTQWSRGSYAAASNTEDDLAVISANGLSVRTDEAGGSVAAAAGTLPAGPAYVATGDDVDVFALGTCTGPVGVAGTGAPTSPDLDLRLRLLDASGAAVATADPATAAGSPRRDATTGLDATVSHSGITGPTYVEVSGVGNGTWSGGYDDYGSLGAYTLALTGTCSPTAGRDDADLDVTPERATPGAPQELVATAAPTDPAVTLGWSAPADPGDSPVTGYTVTASPGGRTQSLGASARQAVLSDLTPGTTYTFTVAARNVAGTGTAATASAVTAAASTSTPPSAPRALSLVPRPLIDAVDVAWTEPADDGGSPRTSYVLTVDGVAYPVAPEWTGVRFYRLARGATHQVSVAAASATGTGATVSGSVQLAGAPPAPTGVALTSSGKRSRVSWEAPAGFDPGLVTGWRLRVVVDGRVRTALSVSVPTRRSHLLGRLPAGRVRVEVAAVSGTLTGPYGAAVVRSTGARPSAPHLRAARPGHAGGPATAVVQWSAPTTDAGGPVTGYRVVAYRLGRQASRVVATQRSVVLGASDRSVELRLSGTRYRFAVQARSGGGFGPLSAVSGSVRAR